ncbi:hypothetical protein SeMB42_g06766 [Synchytrium endobioticum]|uniref:Uncharacterized protein n=1 Tax=Synchytrium endobioticum TaxID=286115 RepID=A0A507CGN4_9FUNG|nr:hypothetical protein SeMB42_g06766 [Synchytrium endobioticum]TPX39185.1 hypothetical protein SeLEV6574_g07389 [Synchytrium endobioticum]
MHHHWALVALLLLYVVVSASWAHSPHIGHELVKRSERDRVGCNSGYPLDDVSSDDENVDPIETSLARSVPRRETFGMAVLSQILDFNGLVFLSLYLMFKNYPHRIVRHLPCLAVGLFLSWNPLSRLIALFNHPVGGAGSSGGMRRRKARERQSRRMASQVLAHFAAHPIVAPLAVAAGSSTENHGSQRGASRRATEQVFRVAQTEFLGCSDTPIASKLSHSTPEERNVGHRDIGTHVESDSGQESWINRLRVARTEDGARRETPSYVASSQNNAESDIRPVNRGQLTIWDYDVVFQNEDTQLVTNIEGLPAVTSRQGSGTSLPSRAVSSGMDTASSGYRDVPIHPAYSVIRSTHGRNAEDGARISPPGSPVGSGHVTPHPHDAGQSF